MIDSMFFKGCMVVLVSDGLIILDVLLYLVLFVVLDGIIEFVNMVVEFFMCFSILVLC